VSACSSDHGGGSSSDAGDASVSTDASVTSDAGSAEDATVNDAAGPAADAAAPSSDGGDAGADPLTMSFVTIGCNRLSKGDWDGGTNPSSANLAQLQQDFTDIDGMTDDPSYFFFTGDLVLGLVPQLPTLSGQLAAWTDVYAAAPIASKLQLVPLPGNHELLTKSSLPDGGSIEAQNNGPDASADAVWTAWLAASKFDSKAGNGPTGAPPNADELADDQSKISYSFDDHGNHYVVLNTDTWSTADAGAGDAPLGWVPMAWLTADLQAAQANVGTSNIFVFGHKPIVSPAGATDSQDVINSVFTEPLEALLDGTAKVRGYFCAHYHAWDARTLPGSRGVYQIIAGNGGSTLDATWNPPVTYFGFSEVRVHQSGKVGVVSYQRPVPNPYNAANGILPAVAQPELILSN
jgi:hypothetical protein